MPWLVFATLDPWYCGWLEDLWQKSKVTAWAFLQTLLWSDWPPCCSWLVYLRIKKANRRLHSICSYALAIKPLISSFWIFWKALSLSLGSSLCFLCFLFFSILWKFITPKDNTKSQSESDTGEDPEQLLYWWFLGYKQWNLAVCSPLGIYIFSSLFLWKKLKGLLWESGLKSLS